MKTYSPLSAQRSFAALSALLLAGTAISRAQDATPATGSTDSVVTLNAFNVSTTLGRYVEDTSSTATKVPTPVKEVPQTLQILNANAIADREAQTIDDLLPYVIGMTKSSNRSVGFALRGFDTSSTGFQNLQIDGLSGTTSSKSSVQTADVESVEILKGPNSVLYGQLKPGGAVNIVTKSPKAIASTTFDATFETFAGSNSGFGDANTYRASLDTTGPIDKAKHWLYRLIVVGQDAEPFRPGDYDHDFYVYPSLTYRWSPQTALTIKAEAIKEKRRADDGLVAPFATVSLVANYRTVYNLPTDVDRDNGEALNADFKSQLNDIWTVHVSGRSLWHVDTRYAFTTNAIQPKSNVVVQNSTIAPKYNHTGNGLRFNVYDFNIFGTVGPENFRNTVIAGSGGGQQFFANPKYGNGPSDPALNIYNPVYLSTAYPVDGTAAASVATYTNTFGLYVSDQIAIYKKLHLTAGLRYGHTQSHEHDQWKLTLPGTAQTFNSTVAQLGALYDLTSELSVYASFSQSFYPNSIANVDTSGRSTFPPEKGFQYEVGEKFETPDQKLRLVVAAYYIKKTNVLANVGLTDPVTSLGISRLDGAQISRGIELENEWFPIPNWELQAGGAYDKAYISATQNPLILNTDLIDAPRWSGNLWTRYNFLQRDLRGLGAGVGAIYVGHRFGGDPTTLYFSEPGYFRFDTAVYYKWRNFDVALNVQNVLDRKYISAVSASFQVYPGDPRKLIFSVNTRF